MMLRVQFVVSSSPGATSPAATAYVGTLPDQKGALAAIKAATDDIDDALTLIAGGVIGFWIAFLAAVVPFVLELTGWGALASTGAGAPPAAAGVFEYTSA
jgi:hypothetical protein